MTSLLPPTACAATVWDNFHSHRCRKPAKIERNGKTWCAIHDPVKLAEKRAKREAAWLAEYEQDRKREQEYRELASELSENLGIAVNFSGDSLVISFGEARRYLAYLSATAAGENAVCAICGDPCHDREGHPA